MLTHTHYGCFSLLNSANQRVFLDTLFSGSTFFFVCLSHEQKTNQPQNHTKHPIRTFTHFLRCCFFSIDICSFPFNVNYLFLISIIMVYLLCIKVNFKSMDTFWVCLICSFIGFFSSTSFCWFSSLHHLTNNDLWRFGRTFRACSFSVRLFSICWHFERV